ESNSYTGKTLVEGGVLQFGTSGKLTASEDIEINGGEMVISAGGQLASTAVVTVNTGGRLVASTGAITIDTLSLAGGTLEINGALQLISTQVELQNAELVFNPAAGASTLDIANGATPSSRANITYNGDLATGNTLLIVGVGETDLKEWTIGGVKIDGNYDLTANSNGFSITPIPEPSTYALFGATGALALALLRRKRKA
ncbi:MAG: PEP-CTERM sorting domain-containing protein, partial [Puniceicoccales bacterium]|nr:PEP-CTERM sorting domain-containing protein [Puniceicoccales bacterium]